MKMRRFFAPSMSQALRQVRREQGSSAVILSQRKVEGGVEVVAAVDPDMLEVEAATEERKAEHHTRFKQRPTELKFAADAAVTPAAVGSPTMKGSNELTEMRREMQQMRKIGRASCRERV